MDWLAILEKCGVASATAAAWWPVFEGEINDQTFSADLGELDDFLGQVLHESQMLERLEENLRYKSAERIAAVWPRRFPSMIHAEPYVLKPDRLANCVYANRMGNGDEASGDGWRYRGRGLIQVTGRDNYRDVGIKLGVDLLGNPDLLATKTLALRSAIAWWEGNIPDHLMGDTVRITKRVNGGTAGLDERVALVKRARAALA